MRFGQQNRAGTSRAAAFDIEAVVADHDNVGRLELPAADRFENWPGVGLYEAVVTSKQQIERQIEAGKGRLRDRPAVASGNRLGDAALMQGRHHFSRAG